MRADRFWRDAALRLEQGKTDVGSFRSWLDADALRREVLLPVVERAEYLPSLRSPVTNRATREPPLPAPPGTVLLISGDFLLGRGLPFDRVIVTSLSPVKRAERTGPNLQWTLPAYERYAAEVRPEEIADVVIKLDRRSLAVRGLD